MDQNHLKRLRSHSARQAKPMKLRRSPNALAVGNKCSKCALHLFNRRDVIGVLKLLRSRGLFYLRGEHSQDEV
ncbi:hypothetical protein PC114_g23905 [Phytophthora cactorum]|uniref:Uncharacterized protein n=1 Tax=Phytophthora cactorum TaxID=29920 RepID=A0A8T1AKL6_9STRA|nr:hypothetical protein PC114_g23905 [Phytophthora cactorum]KAG2880858.1 hypothetical protein PC115_g22391 [Phytophthora cactorum]KAG3052414.1 hypothetical protein PC122_g22663 [Phytophthora cactorum]KAG3139650.1 hypothetical protein C6341_g20270 [Phytophthora cactorum]